MLKRIIRRNLRQPVVTLAVILFAVALTVVLCYLNSSAIEEMRSFEETYVSVPVFFKVTDLDGSKVPVSELNGYKVAIHGGIKGWIVDLFTEDGLKPNLYPYVRDVHIRTSLDADMTVAYLEGRPFPITQPVVVTGITSTYVAEELTEGWGGKIYWNEGYNETVLSTEELVCLVPESLKDKTELELYLYCYVISDGPLIQKGHTVCLKVVGYYVDPGNSLIYCPYPVMKSVYAHLNVSKRIEELGAILNDNYALPELKEVAAQWFAQPNPMGEQTEWGRFGYDYYFYALDIDDNMLRNLETNMKNSMRLNQLASMVVFALSAGSGFLTGFLVIRNRKREISLMRTIGASNPSIFTELALEQVICVAAGILLGGSYSLWQPIGRLILFSGVYCVGLTLALLIFLRKNLLTTIKEDE